MSVFGDGGAARGTDRGGPDTVQPQGLVHLVTVDTGDCRYLDISRYLHNLESHLGEHQLLGELVSEAGLVPALVTRQVVPHSLALGPVRHLPV